MKKLLWILLAWIFGIALSIWSASAASSDCLNVKFYNWDSVCLGITKEWSKNFELSIDKNNLERGSSVRCYIVLPNNTMYTFNGCKGSFYYAWSDTDDVIVSSTYVTRNGNFYSKRMSTDVNFNKGTWASSSNTSSSSSSSSKNSDEIELSTNRKSPSTSQYVNLTIKTDKNYTGRLSLSAKYRSSSSSSWSSISNTSSTYFSDYSDEWDDGYYRMTSSDDGEVVLKNLVKFKKSGYYRIYVEDTDGNESYIQFSVGDIDDEEEESSVDWFSVKELNTVKKVYKERNNMVWQMQRQYPSLKRDTYWIRLSENFYNDMKDVINNKRNRDFSDFDDFQEAFNNRYNYTMRNI